jgi:lipopolysaccharide/colanic/teichoic acid biosynthesis glycosyltransferase
LVRRAFDLAISVPAVVVLGPAMLLIAIAIRIGSPGPAIFRQSRIGRDGAPFTILKFRTMRTAPDEDRTVMGGSVDPRTTRFGGLLRRTKLDELPQFVNVIRGEMAVVGPRAEIPEFVAAYTDAQREVLRILPGITGPAQLVDPTRFEPLLNGAEDPNRVYLEQILGPRLELDLEYVRTRSLLGDIRIVGQTIALILGRHPD